jgi:hypothetical protein
VSGKHDARKSEICVPVEATYKKRCLNLHALACISIPGLETTKIRGKFIVNTSAEVDGLPKLHRTKLCRGFS